jgi:hypothetical protein
MGTWILLVLASILLIGYGIWRAGWHIRLPSPAEQQEVWTGSLFIYAGCALSLGAAVWSGARHLGARPPAAGITPGEESQPGQSV